MKKLLLFLALLMTPIFVSSQDTIQVTIPGGESHTDIDNDTAVMLIIPDKDLDCKPVKANPHIYDCGELKVHVYAAKRQAKA